MTNFFLCPQCVLEGGDKEAKRTRYSGAIPTKSFRMACAALPRKPYEKEHFHPAGGKSGFI
jgi:hypothetical protein